MNDCVICLENINQKSKKISLLCDHIYHEKCISQLHDSCDVNLEIVCPICRSSNNIFQIQNNKDLLQKYYTNENYSLDNAKLELLFDKLRYDNNIDKKYYIERLDDIYIEPKDINNKINNIITEDFKNIKVFSFVIEYLLEKSLKKTYILNTSDYIIWYYKSDTDTIMMCLDLITFTDYTFLTKYIFIENIITDILDKVKLNHNILNLLYYYITSPNTQFIEKYKDIIKYFNTNLYYIVDTISTGNHIEFDNLKLNFIIRWGFYSVPDIRTSQYLFNIIICLPEFDDKYILDNLLLKRKYYTFNYIKLFVKYERYYILDYYNNLFVLSYNDTIDILYNYNSLNNVIYKEMYFNMINRFINNNTHEYQSVNILNGIIIKLGKQIEYDSSNSIYCMVSSLINNIKNYKSIHWDGLYSLDIFYNDLSDKYKYNSVNINTFNIRYYIYSNLDTKSSFIEYLLNDNNIIFSDIIINYSEFGIKILEYIIKNYTIKSISYKLKSMEFALLDIIFHSKTFSDYLPFIKNNINFFKHFCNDKNIRGDTILHSMYLSNNKDNINDYIKIFDKYIDYNITNRFNINLKLMKIFFIDN